MALVFWASAALVVYVYAGYPAILWLWTRLRRPPAQPASADAAPRISIVVAARNEGPRLAARVQNLLGLDYPVDRRQVIVVSDGSSDDTLDVLSRFGDAIEVVALPRPSGKAAALNAGVARARGELLVFADSRQAFAPDALRRLAAPFADPRVGGVSGELLLDCESALFSNRRAAADRRRGHAGQLRASALERRASERRRSVASTIADGVGMYWRYEKELRRMESAVGSTLGATGAIYAIRRALWQPLPPAAILDDVLTPMRVVLAGYRVVFDERARAFDRAAVDADAELRRKVRTLAGNYQILGLEPRLLSPRRNPVWFQYLSHKVGRLVVPYALLALFCANLALAGAGLFYQLLLAGQVGFVLLAGYGALLEVAGRVQLSPRAETARGASSVAGGAAS
jgi:cellulose synthase/poly-beta-1,6-N-acetylglucosamine synthase-like glycosyltransferase